MSTYFVTGVAGFIGSHLAERLLDRGDTVVGLDNLDPYYDPARKCKNLAKIRFHSSYANRFTFVEGDIRDRTLLADLVDEHRPYAIAHLAALAGVRASVAEPHLYLDVNVTGTLNLLEAARMHGVETVVLASTSSVYGNSKQNQFVETDACDRPLAPYPASKRAAEMLGHTYHHLYNLNVTALRFFTVYGPRNRPDMMAHKLLDSIFFDQQVPLYNNGQMYRDWTYVDDITAGIVAALERPLGYEVINLGRGEPVLLADFVEHVEILANQPARLRPEPMPDADVVRTYADVSKARQLLGYNPQISVAEGVQRLWNWYQQEYLEKKGDAFHGYDTDSSSPCAIVSQKVSNCQTAL